MSGIATYLLTVLFNGWLAAGTLLLVVLVLDRPSLLAARARHLVVLAAVAISAVLATGAGGGWGGAVLRAARPGQGFEPAEVSLGPADPMGAWIGPIWAAVAGALVLRELVGHRRLRRRRDGWRAASPSARAAAGWRDGFPLLTGAAGTPLALGIRRPAVYLPERSFRELSPPGLRSVAAHERAHARWRDPATWAAARLVRILLWPVLPLGLLERRLRRLAEEAADAEATAGADDGTRAEYCRTLLAVARWRSRDRASGPAPAMADVDLESRLRTVLRPRRPGRMAGPVVAASGLALAALLAFLPWTRPAPASALAGPGASGPSAAERATFLETLRNAGAEASWQDDRIRIVIRDGDPELRHVVRQAVRDVRWEGRP